MSLKAYTTSSKLMLMIPRQCYKNEDIYAFDGAGEL